jgi:glycosyltransferase involved in cell wall biosynthesis
VWLADRSTANPRGVRLAQTLLPKADMVWVLSTAMVPALSAVYGVAPQRVRYVPMGIDVDFFAATPPADTGLIVSAGNDRHRDHELLVAAFGRLARRNPGVRLTVATRAALEVPPGCPVEVGPRSHGQLRALLAAATVVAVATKPNLHASGLTSVLEGMASGRPVVACDTPGMSEYVTPETGLLVPPGDPGAFAEALGWVLNNPVSAAAMGVAARRRVEEHFTSQAQARRLAALLHETTGRR